MLAFLPRYPGIDQKAQISTDENRARIKRLRFAREYIGEVFIDIYVLSL